MADVVKAVRAAVLETAIQACKEYRSCKLSMSELAGYLASLTPGELEVVSEFTRLRIPTLKQIQALTGAKAP